MPVKHPYTNSSGGLVQMVAQLRRSFPSTVDAETLQKLGIAPKNESYVINVLRFLGIIDDAGQRVDAKTQAFNQHDDTAFAKEFGKLVEEGYAELFDLRQEESWTLSRDELIQFFRSSDGSSAIVGGRQAKTFLALAALAGHGDAPPTPTPTAKKAAKKAATKARPAKKTPKRAAIAAEPEPSARDFGLTVRVEVNLPAEGDQATYDRIFRSIRKNLIEGE